MTVSAEDIKVTHECDNSETEFDFDFKVFQTSDIKVILITVATGVETVLTETTHYSVSGSLSGGGKVTTVATYSSSYQLLITIDIDLDQETDLIYGGSYSSQAVETMSDKLTKIAQQHDETLSRAIKFKPSSSEEDIAFPELTTDAILKVNGDGDGLEMGPTLPDLSTENSLLLVNSGKTGFDEGPTLADLGTSKYLRTNSGGSGIIMGHSVGTIEAYHAGAVAAQEAAELAQTAAELAETNAELAEVNSEAAQALSEAAKDLSEAAQVLAAASESAAADSETAAGLSEVATAADAVSTAADVVSTAADVVTAAASAAAASDSETAAGLSETAGGVSESNAADSETAAGLSEIAAAASAAAAAASAASLNIATPVASKHGALIYQNDDDDGFDLLTSQGTDGQVLKSAGGDAAVGFADIFEANVSANDYRLTDLGDAVDLHDAATLHDVINSIGLVMNYWLMPTSLLSSELTISPASAAQEITGAAGETELTTADTFFKSTVANTPTPFVIKDATIILTHFEAKVDSTTGTKPTTLHAELWRVDSDGSTTPQQIGSDSDSTATLTEDKTLYQLHLHVPTEKIIVASSRLWLRIFATTTGSQGNPDVRIYNGDVHGHVAIPVSGSILGRFVQSVFFTQDSGFLVGTAAGVYQEETGATARGSMGAAASGVNADITSMTGLDNKGIPEAKVIHTRVVVIKCIADDTALAVADGVAHFTIPIELNGMDLVSVGAHVYTVSSSGLPTFMVYNLTDSSNMLSTAITIDENEKDSKDAGTPAVIDTGEDDVVTGDELRFDCTTAGTDTEGMEIRLGFKTP